jgi:GT2 family glycosyltransferase
MRFRYFIDAAGVGHSFGVTGWAFHSGRDIRSLSLAVDGRDPVVGRCGLPRPDVAAAFPDCRSASRSGFVIAGLRAAGRVHLVADLGDGRRAVAPLGHFDPVKGFFPQTRHFNGTVVQLRRRPGLDFSYLEAILRVFAPAPRPLPRLDGPPLVIVPVYGGTAHLAPFFESLLGSTAAPCRVVVVDDGNADPAVLTLLAELKHRANVALLRQAENRGYVEAIAAGFSLWRGEHVVLLNTDTVLPAGWLERLIRPLERDPAVASATPFTNRGNICGFPAMPEDNPPYLGLDVATIDTAVRRIDAAAVQLTIPSGVGFCMAMSRHALSRLGFVERHTFGAGYGEENDWCRKAVAAGLRNLLVPDLYVHHDHGGSFPSAQKQRLMARNRAIIDQRYPDYAGEVCELILADPLAELRAFAAFLLAAQAHPDGALMSAAGETAPDERPGIIITVSSESLAWTYDFRWPHGRFRLSGGNLGEIEALGACLKIGADSLKADDLRHRLPSWSAVTPAGPLLQLPGG